MNSPQVLFLDEPTSGLDSLNALRVMRSLLQLCRARGTTVVCTLHQPRSNLFHMFQNLLLLHNGRTVFFGRAALAVSHFASLGVVCPVFVNPADFLLDVLEEEESNERDEEEDAAEAEEEEEEEAAEEEEVVICPLVHLPSPSINEEEEDDDEEEAKRALHEGPMRLQAAGGPTDPATTHGLGKVGDGGTATERRTHSCPVVWCGVICCAVLCCAVLWCGVVLCCGVLWCGAVVWCAVLCCGVVCCSVVLCGVVCCSVVCCAVLCCAVYADASIEFITRRSRRNHKRHAAVAFRSLAVAEQKWRPFRQRRQTRSGCDNDADNSTAQHSTPQHSTAHHTTAHHTTPQHTTPQRTTAQHTTPQHSTAHHSTTAAQQHSTAEHADTDAVAIRPHPPPGPRVLSSVAVSLRQLRRRRPLACAVGSERPIRITTAPAHQ